MPANGTGALPLAPRPDLDHYRTLARELHRACRTGDPEAVREWARHWLTRLARLLIEGGPIEYLRAQSRPKLESRIEEEASFVVRSAEREIGLSSATVSDIALADAQRLLAWLHGFESWPRFVHHLESIARDDSPVTRFEAAADAVVVGDLAKLRALIRQHPALVHERSTRDHHSTLLHYVAANGHEGFRQRTPPNAVDIARFLLEAGAEADALADMYGHSCTTMEMVVSSVHPHQAGVQSALVELLVDFGAAADGIDGDQSPLLTSLRFHYPDAAITLVRRGAKVNTVTTAAALGRDDLVRHYVIDGKTLHPDMHYPRGPWPRLTRDPQQHLGYAITWAATWGHARVVEVMLQKGVDSAGRDDDGTPLHGAAGHGHMTIVRLLLEHGASLEWLNNYGGTVLSSTLWFAYNSPVNGVDYSAVVRELLELGARTDLYPKMEEHVRAVIEGRLP